MVTLRLMLRMVFPPPLTRRSHVIETLPAHFDRRPIGLDFIHAIDDELAEATIVARVVADPRFRNRGQKLAQMALAWVLRHPVITTALIGASKISQLEDNLAAAQKPAFTAEELAAIDRILAS